MNKLIAFVRLDVLSVKPYLTPKNLLIYLALAFFFTFTSGGTAAGLSVGLMLGTMFINYPFFLSEKSNMDALYATLAVSRKTVVLGRYVFALLLDACLMLFDLGLSMARVLVRGEPDGEVFVIMFVMLAILLFLQSIQLPMFFKLSYSKAKLFALIPYLALFVGTFAAVNVNLSVLPDYFVFIGDSGLLIPLVAAALLLIVFVSYRLSVSFYARREF